LPQLLQRYFSNQLVSIVTMGPPPEHTIYHRFVIGPRIDIFFCLFIEVSSKTDRRKVEARFNRFVDRTAEEYHAL
jgi:hypothetical protein